MENENKKNSELRVEILNFKEVCKPVVDYIQKHYGGSHVKVIVTCDHAELVKGQLGVPFKFED